MSRTAGVWPVGQGIHDGQIGEICAAARLRMDGRSARSDRAQAGRISDLLYKFSVSTAYCGRAAATQDFYIHLIDHMGG